jgi:hypothetical protein
MPEAPGVKVVIAEPMLGIVAKVTVDSDQAEVTGDRVIAPGVLMRLTNSVIEALEICEAVIPVGREEMSYCSNDVLPLPTYKFARLPRFVLARAEVTDASPTKVTSVA